MTSIARATVYLYSRPMASWIEQKIRRYEQKRWAQEPNRRNATFRAGDWNISAVRRTSGTGALIWINSWRTRLRKATSGSLQLPQIDYALEK